MVTLREVSCGGSKDVWCAVGTSFVDKPRSVAAFVCDNVDGSTCSQNNFQLQVNARLSYSEVRSSLQFAVGSGNGNTTRQNSKMKKRLNRKKRNATAVLPQSSQAVATQSNDSVTAPVALTTWRQVDVANEIAPELPVTKAKKTRTKRKKASKPSLPRLPTMVLRRGWVQEHRRRTFVQEFQRLKLWHNREKYIGCAGCLRAIIAVQSFWRQYRLVSRIRELKVSNRLS